MRKPEEEIADFLTYNVEKLVKIRNGHPEISQGFSNVINALFEKYTGTKLATTSKTPDIQERKWKAIKPYIATQLDMLKSIALFRNEHDGSLMTMYDYKLSNMNKLSDKMTLDLTEQKLSMLYLQYADFMTQKPINEMQFWGTQPEWHELDSLEKKIIEEQISGGFVFPVIFIGRQITGLNNKDYGIINRVNGNAGLNFVLETDSKQKPNVFGFDFMYASEYYDFIDNFINAGMQAGGSTHDGYFETATGDMIRIESHYNKIASNVITHKPTSTSTSVSVYPIGYDIAPNTGGSRKGPTQSASQTDENVMAIGNDGAWWRIAKNPSSGVKKWKRMKTNPTSDVIPLTDLTEAELKIKSDEINENLEYFDESDPEYKDFKEQLKMIKELTKN